MNPENIVFILVRPEFLGNIGSVARVMKNFGLSKLRFVDPPRNYKDAEARKMAVGAFDLLKASEVYQTLTEALQDINLAVATTSGKQRETPLVAFNDLVPKIISQHNERIGIVFGCERDGLSREEIIRCHYATTIQTNPNFPALNLAQAAAIIAYELTKTTVSDGGKGETSATPIGAEDDQLFTLVETVLDQLQFTRTYNRDLVVSELRSFYQRACPTTREADLLRGVLHKFLARNHSN